ncbi:MAG: TIGR03546 family protein [Gammaproteobacteria bacterium]|nr:TIGR03546 family protein [Sideroxydans sp.]MBU3903743.1 TIGR03546 family protein [Gammaproteobacteria bacterium]MBU4046112.1 TIGR03546 family protein [Gammaproteobacteria bacterium]MBU4150476.1 TIGR03546 family protein [Gammaproteobacteria bacterium]
MTLLLKQLFALLRLLNSDTGTNQIAAGVACGLILGFAPMLSLQGLLVFLCMFLFRIQIGAALTSAVFFAMVAWLFDPVSHALGVAILETASLQPLFTTLYNLPLVPLTRFYNSVVMGAGVMSVLLAPLVFFGSKLLIALYREKVVARFKSSPVWKLWSGTTFFKWYSSYEKFHG